MTRNSTKSKHSTESDTATRKPRWVRLGAPAGPRAGFENILDLYWGGKERRITTLALRIVGVNCIALIMLAIGMLFLGQHRENLIQAKLESFTAEVSLIAAALSEAALDDTGEISLTGATNMLQRFDYSNQQRIRIFDKNGEILADSLTLPKEQSLNHAFPPRAHKESFNSVRILKEMASFIINLLPQKRPLPVYSEPETANDSAQNHQNAKDALSGHLSLSAWIDSQNTIVLTGAAPLHAHSPEIQQNGAVLVNRTARDINDEVGDFWLNILAAFIATLVLTILLSIYLYSTIATPLRRLATSAEGVRKGKLSYHDIPDLHERNDEIGELSIALREMTGALWDRMDSIDRFAADVSHELKNPLTSLRSAVETASIVKKKEDHQKLMDIIKHDIERLDRLITDISHASRLDSELSRDIYKKTSLRQTVNNLLNAYKNPLEREQSHNASWNNHVRFNDINIRSDSDTANDIFVWGLGSRLEQVFRNILVNALSFSPPESTVHIHIRTDKNTVRIIFEDQGKGIPENKLDSIFERFYTQRPEHEAYGKHSGLGLSICKQIVTAMGGEIYAEHIKNADNSITGARFIVSLNKA